MSTSSNGPEVSAERVTVTRSPAETREFAARLLGECRGARVFALHGELGSGKTCFVQGLAAAAGVVEAVTSPTYIMINEYEGRRRICHMDLYRTRGEDEVLSLGLDEYLDEADTVIVIEWAERAGALLPPGTVHVTFERAAAEGERRITVRRA